MTSCPSASILKIPGGNSVLETTCQRYFWQVRATGSTIEDVVLPVFHRGAVASINALFYLSRTRKQSNVLIHLILTSAVLCTPLQVEVSDPAAAAFNQQVQKLLRQLDSDLLAQRQAAEKALIALGPQVLDRLPEEVDSAEVRQRLQRVVKTLQLQASRHATAASRVDLKGKMNLATALKSLQQQTGNRIQARGQLDAPVQVDLQQVIFWEALDRILDQVQMNVDPFLGGRTALALTARPPEEQLRQPSASYGGIFRFEALRVEASRHLRNPKIRGLKVALQVAWEPRLTPIFLSLPAAQLKVLDDQGKPLAVDNLRGASSAAIEGDRTAVELTVPLQLPSRDIRKIASLQGQLETLLPGKPQRFEFARLQMKNQLLKKAGVSVILLQVDQQKEELVAHVKVAYEQADQAFESHRGWVYLNPAYLELEPGKSLKFRSYETLAQGPRSVTLAYRFQRPENMQNVRFIYETPATIVRQQVSFELRDILLP